MEPYFKVLMFKEISVFLKWCLANQITEMDYIFNLQNCFRWVELKTVCSGECVKAKPDIDLLSVSSLLAGTASLH